MKVWNAAEEKEGKGQGDTDKLEKDIRPIKNGNYCII
jgi:hypothetical protein